MERSAARSRPCRTATQDLSSPGPIRVIRGRVLQSRRRTNNILEVSKLGCVRGDRRLFSGLDLSVSPGTFVQLTGPNGSGKTSLLRILCGLLERAEGKISWEGADIRSLGEEYVTEVTYLGHRHGIKDEFSAVENLRISN